MDRKSWGVQPSSFRAITTTNTDLLVSVVEGARGAEDVCLALAAERGSQGARPIAQTGVHRHLRQNVVHKADVNALAGKPPQTLDVIARHRSLSCAQDIAKQN